MIIRRWFLLVWLGALGLRAWALEGPLPATRFVRVTQSSEAAPANAAARALDGIESTYSLTADAAGSFWQGELGRAHELRSIQVVNRAAPDDRELDGLALRLFNLDDQVVFQTTLTNPGPGGTWSVELPAGLRARVVWIGLPGDQANAAGNHRVGLAEVRLIGELKMPFGPEPPATATSKVRVYQSSDYDASFPAVNAVDGDVRSFSHTADGVNGYWMADWGSAAAVDRLELVNRFDCCAARFGGLVARLYDGASNSVFSAIMPNGGQGSTWATNLPAGLRARYLRVGLENGGKNLDGNYYVSVAEARVFSGGTDLLRRAPVGVTDNLASFKKSYMVRLTESIAPASLANDHDIATETKTTTQTVDGYWETDLGETFALYGVRVIGASGIGNRMTNTTLRLYDGAHESVQARRLTGTPDVFDTDLDGPVFARYVRVGLENKRRTDPGGGLEWYIGMREVEVYGRPTNEVGVLAFSASQARVDPGQPVTLSWSVAEAKRLELRPAVGSVGSNTLASGTGSMTLMPERSTEYILISSNAAGLQHRATTVEVGGAKPHVLFSEVVADNRDSLRDGYGEASDWIELRNPGNEAVNLAGHFLSDEPRRPKKWAFPAVEIAAHGTLIVFASGRTESLDPKGFPHANFRLGREGETLGLIAPDGTVLDVAVAPALDTDLAYGRDLDGRWTLMEPTPGAINTGAAYEGWLRPLTFSHERGFNESAFTLTITNPNPGASVLYSLDGSTPSIPYSAGIPVTGTKAVRALVQRAGHRPARIQTASYVFVNEVIASSLMRTSITRDARYAPRMRPGLLALPSVSVVVPATPGYEEQEGSLEILWPNGAPATQANCGVSVFGGSWQRFAKDSLKVKCRARYGTSRIEAPLFDGFDHGTRPQHSFDELELRAGDQDMIDRGFYMAGRFMQDTMLDMGSLNPHGRFVHLYLNGYYWGLYDARETLTEHFLADYLGGTSDDYVSVKGNDNVGDNFVVGTPSPPNVLPWERVLSLRGSYAAVRPYLDVQSLTDFMLMWFYGDCESEFRACGPLTAGSGFKFWTADPDGFLRTSALGANRTANAGPGGIFGALVREGDSDFKTLVADRIYLHCFNDGALTPARNDARLAARMLEVRDALLAECARWGYRTSANWESAAATIRSSLFPARTAQLVGILRSRGLYPKTDPPSLDLYGGVVPYAFQPHVSAPGGTIYYTLDGSDPRLPGGAPSPQARVWTDGTVWLTNSLTMNTRVRASDGQWSALAQPNFRVAPPLRLAARVEAGLVTLSFPGLGGEVYQIESATDAANPDWQPWRQLQPMTDGRMEVSDTPGNTAGPRYYRVRWLR